MRYGIAALVLSFAAASLPAQTFDAASVNVHQQSATGNKYTEPETVTPTPGGLNASNARLQALIAWAYSVRGYQVAGPAWLESERYDIAAKAAGAVPQDEIRKMLQPLLAGRFKVTLHREQKELPVYVLQSAGKNTKLETAPADATPVFRISPAGLLVFENYSLAEFALWLSETRSFALDRPVLDQTGLAGRYNFSLKLGETIAEMKRTLGTNQDHLPELYAESLRESDIRLVSRKAALEVLVVDHAGKLPTGN